MHPRACIHLGPLLLAKLKTLKAYGFSKDSLTLMRSFFTDRKGRSKLGALLSDWKPIDMGCPQGSNLGPLLWNIYQQLYQMISCTWIVHQTDQCMLRSSWFCDDHQFYYAHSKVKDQMDILSRMKESDCRYGTSKPLSLKVGRGRGDGDAGTRVWDAELGDARLGTWGRVYRKMGGRGDLGTRRRGDAGTRGREDAGDGDAGTRGREDAGDGDAGTRGRGDAGTRGRGDAGTRGRGDAGTRGHPFNRHFCICPCIFLVVDIDVWMVGFLFILAYAFSSSTKDNTKPGLLTSWSETDRKCVLALVQTTSRLTDPDFVVMLIDVFV